VHFVHNNIAISTVRVYRTSKLCWQLRDVGKCEYTTLRLVQQTPQKPHSMCMHGDAATRPRDRRCCRVTQRAVYSWPRLSCEPLLFTNKS